MGSDKFKNYYNEQKFRLNNKKNLDKIENIDKENNSKIIKSFFSVNKYQKQLSRIFNEKLSK